MFGKKRKKKQKQPYVVVPLSNEQAVEKLQFIKPYFAYRGRTQEAIDMAVRALLREAEDSDGVCGKQQNNSD